MKLQRSWSSDLFLLFAIISLGFATSANAEVKVYADWVVGCDNWRDCEAGSLLADAANEKPLGDGSVAIWLKRGGGPYEGPSLDLFVDEQSQPARAESARRLVVRGARGVIFTLPVRVRQQKALIASNQIRALLAAMAKGQVLAVEDPKGMIVGSASLLGIRAALLFIDAEQDRTGTVTALIALGSKSAVTIPLNTPEPDIEIPRASEKPPSIVSVARLAELRMAGPCPPDGRSLEPDQFHRLDAATTLLILSSYCGGYNAPSGLFTIDEQGTAHPVVINSPVSPVTDEAEDEHDALLAGVWWDVRARTLESFVKDRVLSDCGRREEFAWDGKQLILVRREEMPVCRGNYSFITTYRRGMRVQS